MTGDGPADLFDAPSEPSWDEKVQLLNTALAERGLDYAFGGAIALNYHREPRATLDIDINIFLPPDQQQQVLSVLTGLYAPLSDQNRVSSELHRDGQTRTTWGNTYVDLFMANTDFHESMARRIEHQPFGDLEIPVLSIEDLLVCKVLFDRAKDWLDLEAVAQTHEHMLDMSYMTNWLSEFLGPDDARLKRVRALVNES